MTKGMKPLQPLLANPIHPQMHEIQLGELKSVEEFEAAHNQYLKQVEAKAHEQVMLSWEPALPLPFKLLPWLFCLVPYVFRKYDWSNSSIDDFNKQLENYRAFPKRGWTEWVDNIFSTSLGQWTMKIK
jgi:hypothetical protein